jgi:hypothetical protein
MDPDRIVLSRIMTAEWWGGEGGGCKVDLTLSHPIGKSQKIFRIFPWLKETMQRDFASVPFTYKSPKPTPDVGVLLRNREVCPL